VSHAQKVIQKKIKDAVLHIATGVCKQATTTTTTKCCMLLIYTGQHEKKTNQPCSSLSSFIIIILIIIIKPSINQCAKERLHCCGLAACGIHAAGD
jgi:hypothetical protein